MPHTLVVEDSPEVARALQVLLEASGQRVTTAGSGGEALDAARAEPVDLMLLDLTLPDMDGLEVLRTLRAEGCAPRVTVALTGRDEPAIHRRCLDAGCVAVRVKPVPARELVRMVGEWIDGRHRG